MNWERWVRRCALAKRRVQEAAGVSGRIGDPGNYLLALIRWAGAHGMEAEAALMQESWDANYREVQ